MLVNSQSILAGKRVLFVLCGFDLGGAERQALHFARHLKNLGCDVRVWGHHHGFAGPELVIEHCEAAGIPWAVHKFRWPCRKKSFFPQLWGLLRGLYRERPDVILPYLPWPSTGCNLVWRFSPAQVCIWGQRDCGDLRGDAVQRFAYRRSSAVICNAAHEVDYLRHTVGETTAPVYVVHNGVEMAPARKARAEWRAELGIEENAAVATMVANFRHQKDHPTLLRAWRKVLSDNPKAQPGPRLLLAGAHQESYGSVRQLARDLGLLHSASFPGQVKDVAGLLAASDIGILSTTHEGLPNAILEYMTCGLPVVATDIPGNREALGNEPQQFCKPNDAASLASTLEPLLMDANLRQRLGARNRQRALEEFSVGRMCKTMAGIIGDLLNGGSRGGGERGNNG